MDDVTKTREFKRWFGDWEADPKGSSKVVDKDGTPLVVYHGSRAKGFTVFDTKPGSDRKSRMQLDFGTHFTSEKYASTYVKKKGSMYRCYLNIRNPLRLPAFAWKGEDGFDTLMALQLAVKKGKLPTDAYRDKSGALRDEQQNACVTGFMLDSMPPARARKVVEDAGFDGIAYEPYHPAFTGYGLMGGVTQDASWIALRPNQIKLADGSNASFSDSDDIREAALRKRITGRSESHDDYGEEAERITAEYYSGKMVGKAIYDVYSDRVFVVSINSLMTGSGRAMVESIMAENPGKYLCGESTPQALGFWRHMGAEFPDGESESLSPFVISGPKEEIPRRLPLAEELKSHLTHPVPETLFGTACCAKGKQWSSR